jgi:hypothetical protein
MEGKRLVSERDCKYAKICPCAYNRTCDGPRYKIIGSKMVLDYDICIPRIIGQTCCVEKGD